MGRRKFIAVIVALLLFQGAAHGSLDTLGTNGINSLGLTLANGQPLNGRLEVIGQVEETRPGKRTPAGPDDVAHSNATVVPEDVFRYGNLNVDPPANNNIDDHAEAIAGIMISTDPTYMGVTGGGNLGDIASLFSGALVADQDIQDQAAQTAQAIASYSIQKVAAINFSFGIGSSGNPGDGNSPLALFVDWSAARYNVLYVMSGTETTSAGFIPKDNFNGIVVGAMTKETDGVYRRVMSTNVTGQIGNRTFVSLLAPGDGVQVAGINGTSFFAGGTSVAAPHVTGSVALLQQYAHERITAGAPGWTSGPNAHSLRHETYKAILLNSADKIKDDGMLAPMGTFLGMDKTVLDKSGNNWLSSEAINGIDADLIPLDDEMGAGALNVKRAVKQFSSGEWDNNAAPVPAIGWDYGHTNALNSINKYALAQPLRGGSYISITLAFDRKVVFDGDGGSANFYDHGDTFKPYTATAPYADDQINDLDLYLVHQGATDFDDPVALSISADSTIEHIFAPIPTTGMYEIWVHQYDNDLGGGQDYALAWWANPELTSTPQGDYNGDHVVDAQDYAVWRNAFGNSVTPGSGADGNGDGVIDNADYILWRKNVNAGSGSSLASVPEPSALLLSSIAVVVGAASRRRVS